jgi:hypothetical protein
MTDKFKEWVLRWEIGPGMNDDRHRPNSKFYSGFDGSVGDGWIGIIDRLASDLINLGWDRDLHQVKEKFGGLRFYTGASSPEMNARIHQAEEESYKTCENCGDPGNPNSSSRGWVRTLCNVCRDVREKK